MGSESNGPVISGKSDHRNISNRDRDLQHLDYRIRSHAPRWPVAFEGLRPSTRRTGSDPFVSGTTGIRASLSLRSETPRGDTMGSSRRVPKTKAHRQISPKSLKERMSEVISLRERLAQAELKAGQVPTFLKEGALPDLVFDEPQTRDNA